jgi:hypothetical protein
MKSSVTSFQFPVASSQFALSAASSTNWQLETGNWKLYYNHPLRLKNTSMTAEIVSIAANRAQKNVGSRTPNRGSVTFIP